jgi:hypothetical protein
VRAALLALVLLVPGCATIARDDSPLGWFCSAEANLAPVRASSYQALDVDGGLREGRTQLDLTLAGDQPARLLADWDGTGVPEVAGGRYRFRMSRHVVPSEPGQLQLVAANRVLSRSDWSPGLTELTVSGRVIAPELASGAALQLLLVGRDGRRLGTAAVDRSSFDQAVQLSRQANAGVLAKATDFRRQCQREERIILT